MKTKVLVMIVTLLFALGMRAQTATQAAPTAPAAGENAKACSCCNHDKADAKAGEKTSCCGKDGGCCKDGKMVCCSGDKCPMMTSKDGKMADGKSCCAGDKCPMMAKGQKGDHGCCCGNMAEHEHAGV